MLQFEKTKQYILKEGDTGPKGGDRQPGHEGGREGTGTRPSGTGGSGGDKSGGSQSGGSQSGGKK